MSGRSYLSIGDVLSLLRQEFPDVTISKIRFLESQGLVNPERTPSGYRKFYEHDVERLRWVLRQQREHFLPLKVIKGRLDGDSDGDRSGADTPAAHRNGSAPTSETDTAAQTDTADHSLDAAASENGRRRAPVLTSVPTGSTSDGPQPVVPGREAGVSTSSAAMAAAAATGGSGGPGLREGRSSTPIDHRASGEVTGAPAVPPVGRVALGGDAPKPSTPAPAVAHSAPTPESPAEPAPGRPAMTDGRPSPLGAVPSGSTEEQSSSLPLKDSAGAPATGTEGSTVTPSAPSDPATATSLASLAGGTGASLTMDELSAASGLSADAIVELRQYGLLRATMVAGAEYFDEEALTVATVAGRFATMGVEARHLRLYRNAAEREAGFIEQIVTPLLRQRNPRSRSQAVESTDELVRIGNQLRASLLRSALRDVLER